MNLTSYFGFETCCPLSQGSEAFSFSDTNLFCWDLCCNLTKHCLLTLWILWPLDSVLLRYDYNSFQNILLRIATRFLIIWFLFRMYLWAKPFLFSTSNCICWFMMRQDNKSGLSWIFHATLKSIGGNFFWHKSC